MFIVVLYVCVSVSVGDGHNEVRKEKKVIISLTPLTTDTLLETPARPARKAVKVSEGQTDNF